MDHSNLAISLDRLAPTPAAAAETALALGIQAITFAGTPRAWTPGQPALSFLWDDLDPATQAATRELRSIFARGVIHAPFVDIHMVSTNSYIQAESLRQLYQAIRAAGELELETVTVHAPLPIQSLTHADFRRRLVLTLRELGRAAHSAGTRIGLENWRYPFTPEEHLSILEEVDHPAVGATLDLGHIAYWYKHEGTTGLHNSGTIAQYQARLMAFIEQLGAYIIHVHVHDVRASDLQDHRTVGSGIINYAAVLDGLARHGFDGLMLFELGEPDFPTALGLSLHHINPLLHRLAQPLLEGNHS